MVSRSLACALRDHVDLEPIAHAGLLEIGAEGAVDEADGRKVLHAGEAERLQVVEELSIRQNGSVPFTPASTGVCLTTGSTSRAISTTMSLALP